MKTIVCNILFIGFLCFGFSVHATGNESEWITCILADKCLEMQKIHVVKIDYNKQLVKIHFNNTSHVVSCAHQNFHEGKVCPPVTANQ